MRYKVQTTDDMFWRERRKLNYWVKLLKYNDGRHFAGFVPSLVICLSPG